MVESRFLTTYSISCFRTHFGVGEMEVDSCLHHLLHLCDIEQALYLQVTDSSSVPWQSNHRVLFCDFNEKSCKAFSTVLA